MNTIKILLGATGTLSVALSSPLAAQTSGTVIPAAEAQGMFTGLHTGVQLAPSATQVVPSSKLRIRSAGVYSGSLEPWSSTEYGGASAWHPDYSPEALYGHWVPAATGYAGVFDPTLPFCVPELGGMSTGGDVSPPVDSTGTLQLATSSVRWHSMTFTVDSAAQGETGSSVDLARSEEGTAAGRIFSYFSVGSTGIRQELVDTVRVEYTRSQLGLGTTAFDGFEVSALDWGMGLISSTPGEGPTSFQPVRDTFYFTLARRWLDSFGSPLAILVTDPMTSLPVPHLLDPATVYVMTWDGTDWSQPEIAFDHDALFGTVTAVDLEIDALSVYRRSGEEPDEPGFVVFSLDPASTINGSTPNQVLVSQRASGTGLTVQAEPFKVPGGDTFTFKAGLLETATPTVGPDNVKGLCGRDPRDEMQPFDTQVGFAADWAGGPATSGLGLAMARVDGPLDAKGIVDYVVLQASGIELSQYDAGLLVFDLEVVDPKDDVTPLQFNPMVTSDPLLIPNNHSTGELFFGLQVDGSGQLRSRARLYGVQFVPLMIVPDIEASWVNVLSLP
ncbi:hypothetical protein [Engelhardtia mirabilis]|uniref:Uncharacterized protein n=1 Tax=Engelhardtia mirabilis TaxID=2528011 RepID=A0A518BFA7_9BACT|nr:hypothetical protein Pla133_07340 [Planctomycetes bacterium Pla133]QDU99994.1 hypothetical protein Pla86_07330 [Planctomycetes bacterium Pla86]